MSTPTLLGFGLIAIGILDAVIGFLVVLPRSPEATRPVLRVAMMGASALLILLGGAILAGWLNP